MPQPEAVQRPLLIPAEPVLLRAVTRFAVKDTIQVGARIGNYSIGWVDATFQHHFGQYVESFVPQRSLRSHTLGIASCDVPIIAALDGNLRHLGPAATALAHLLVGVIALGTEGPGDFDGYFNIGYAMSHTTYQPLVVAWQIDRQEISIRADSVSVVDHWSVGDRVFGG